MNKALAPPSLISSFLDFSLEWQKISEKNTPASDLKIKLLAFINKWEQIGWRPETPTPTKEINVVQLNDFLLSAEPVVKMIKDARRNGEMANVWEIAGLKRDEVRISSVLAWFLNQYGEHGQGSGLLRSLVNRINSLYPSKTSCFVIEEIYEKPFCVNVESCPIGERESRVDIEISGELFLLFIEVKIDALETNNQIQRYLEIADKKSLDRPWLVLFLTPTGKQPIKSPNHPQLLPIMWKDVAYAFRSYANNELLEKCHAKLIIQQFAEYVSKF